MSKQFNMVDQHNLFKINYYKKSENMYNSDNVLQGRLKKKYNFTGKQKFVSTPLSFSGGVGAGKLPKSNNGKYEGAIITSKRCYATCEIEREAMKASADDKGAFVRATKETVMKTVESYLRNGSRILLSDGTGILGRLDSATNVVSLGGGLHTITVSEASWKEANWEEMDYIQVVSGMNAYPDNSAGAAEGNQTEVNLLEITEVHPDTREIDLEGASPILVALNGATNATTGFCMQKSLNEEPHGFDSIFKFGVDKTGSLYNIPYQRRWAPFLKDANASGITTSLLNHVMLKTKMQCGKAPSMITCGEDQYQNIIDLLEDQKIYNLPNKNLKGHMGFEGVEYVGAGGKKIGIFMDRFIAKDQVLFINTDRVEGHHRPGFGWFDDDGTVFLRLQDDDAYGARYGGYMDYFITPTGHGFLYNLAV